MCLHEWRLWSPQQIVYNPSASLKKLIYDHHIAVIHHVSFFFLSSSNYVSYAGFFFSHFKVSVDDMEMGGWIRFKKHNREQKQNLFFSTEMWCYWLALAPKFETLVDALFLTDKCLTLPVFVVFELVSSNNFKPKSLELQDGVRDTFLTVAHFF